MEVLASPVSPHNDPLIKDLYEKLPDATNVEAAKIALALQKVIRGENLQETDPDAYQAYMQFMENVDKASATWNADREQFLTDALDEANKPTEAQAAQMRKDLIKRYGMIKEDVRAGRLNKKKFMKDHIKNGPFEAIYVEPKMVMGRVGESQMTSVEGQVISLCGVQMYLPPGQNERVPSRYAERYRQILQGQKETEARKQVLQGVGIDPSGGKDVLDGYQQMAARMTEINKEFGSSSGGGEAGDDWMSPELYQRF